MRTVADGDSPYRDVTLKGLLLSFFGQLLDRAPLTEPRAEDSSAIRAIVDYCASHFMDDLSLEALEDALHLSRYYISHLFSHKLKIRFNDYVNSLRVSEACRLLRNTSLSMTDIGTRVGFNTLRTFNRSFGKQMGQTPSEYRRRSASERQTI
jgi:YesN/AraC family two-component response regulator